MKTDCVVNFAKGLWFPKGQDRLMRSLCETSSPPDAIGFQDESQIGAPAISEIRTAFKLFSIMTAATRGYRRVLWLDASMWAVKSIQPLFDLLARDGYLVLSGGNKVGNWSSDSCLEHFGVSRNLAMCISECMGGCYGVDLSSRAGRALFARCFGALEELEGPQSNDAGKASADPRVCGHRCQAVLSLAAFKLGLDIHESGEAFSDERWHPNDYVQRSDYAHPESTLLVYDHALNFSS